MERHFEKALARLGRKLETMFTLCRESLEAASSAFAQSDARAAEPVFLNERRVNQLEIEIDNDVAETFALFQPVAVDLRYLLAVLKINNDLERINDHAVNIAQSVVSFASRGTPVRLELPRMFDLALSMFADSTRCFFEKDLQLARTVLEADDMVDGLNRSTARDAVQGFNNGDFPIETALELMRIARNLERVADLSTNIAEEAMFHVQAKVIRHSEDGDETV